MLMFSPISCLTVVLTPGLMEQVHKGPVLDEGSFLNTRVLHALGRYSQESLCLSAFL